MRCFAFYHFFCKKHNTLFFIPRHIRQPISGFGQETSDEIFHQPKRKLKILKPNELDAAERLAAKQAEQEDELPIKKPKTDTNVVIPKQENTIVFKSELEKKAFEELTSAGKKYQTNEKVNFIIPMTGEKSAVEKMILEAREKEGQPKEQKVKVEPGLLPEEDSQLSKFVNGKQHVTIGEPADYSNIQVEDFGMAMLKGMGWNKDRGIGRTFASNTTVHEVKKRPTGLGLGANLDDYHETLFAIGDSVKITEGAHKNTKGVIISMDVEKVRVTVQTKSGKNYEVSELICKKYDKKTDELESKSGKKDHSDRYSSEKYKIAMPKKSKMSAAEEKAKLTAFERVNPAFLVPDIKVRLIDETHPDYKKKFTVRSVLTPYVALLNNGKEFHQSVLESVIPKKINCRVAIINGEYKGSVGHLNSKNKNDQTVVVDFWDKLTNHHVKTFSFDDISELDG